MLKKAWDWLVKSSADPQKTALTVKAGLNTIIGILLVVGPAFHLNLGKTQLDEVAEAIVQMIIYAYAIISSVAMIMGFIRKIKITLFG